MVTKAARVAPVAAATASATRIDVKDSLEAPSLHDVSEHGLSSWGAADIPEADEEDSYAHKPKQWACLSHSRSPQKGGGKCRSEAQGQVWRWSASNCVTHVEGVQTWGGVQISSVPDPLPPWCGQGWGRVP